jgi:hypothetical protein
MDNRAAEQYLNEMFGNGQGYVAVAYKDRDSSWQECQFAWPAERNKLMGWAGIHQDANVFICPALRRDPHTRKKGDGSNLKWLWADVDWDKVPAEKVAEVNARIKDLGTYIVSSGTGSNAHVYVGLTGPVDPAEHLKLNTGLRDYLYADHKQADNSLLRLPGTTNWKTDAGAPVALRGGNGRKVSKASLLKRRAFRDAKVLADAELLDWTFIEVEGLPRRVKAMVTMPTPEAEARYGNRHKAVWAITGELHRRGLGPDEIHSLMDKFPPAISKASEENGYDVHKDVEKRLLYDRAKAPVEDETEADQDAGEVFEEVTFEEMQASLVSEGVEKELLRRSIRRAADMAEAMRGHTEPPPDASVSLSDALGSPPAPVQWLIDGLCSAEANVVIPGQYKSGKTKLMMASLVTALADNEPFLGSRAVHVPEGGAVVGHWNLEMSALDLIDKYMRPAGFKNPHNVHLANWRGYRLNILTDPGKTAAVEWLKSRGVQVWTLDSWTALCRMCGVDTNSGSEVSMLLGRIDEIKMEAGVKVFFFLAHTARASSEADKPGTRGASEVDDLVDSRWMFTVDKSEVRWLQAEGRDTQMSAVSLDFNEDTGRSVIGAVTRQSAAQDGAVQLVVKTLRDMGPGKGLGQAALVAKLKEVRGGSVTRLREYIADAEEAGFIRIEKVPRPGGGRHQLMHYLTSDEPPEGNRQMNATPREVNLATVNVRGRRRK